MLGLEKIQWLNNLIRRLYEDAARMAVARKDTSEFEFILSKCDRDTATKVKEIFEAFKTPGAASQW